VDSPADIGLDFSGEQSASFYDRMTGCMDVKALLIDSIVGDDLPQEAADCLHENLSDDLVERVVTIGYTQGETGLDAARVAVEVEEAVAFCMALSATTRRWRRRRRGMAAFRPRPQTVPAAVICVPDGCAGTLDARRPHPAEAAAMPVLARRRGRGGRALSCRGWRRAAT
jgi:hypothetical protein